MYGNTIENKPVLNNANAIIDFPANKNNSLKTEQITVQTDNDGTKTVEIMIPVKCLGNFCRTLKTPLINCQILF